MGGFFSAPSSTPLPPPPPPVDTGEEERKRRVEAIERRRRGRTGTIATSERGVLDQRAPSSSGSPDETLQDKLGD